MGIKAIATGFFNLAKKELLGIHHKEIEVLAVQRYAICLACEEKNEFKICKICNCYLPAKVRVKEHKCPESKW